MGKDYIWSKVLSFEPSSLEGINVSSFTDEEKSILISFFVKYFEPWYKEHMSRKILFLPSKKRILKLKDINEINFHDCVLYSGLCEISDDIINDPIHQKALTLIHDKILQIADNYAKVIETKLPKK